MAYKVQNPNALVPLPMLGSVDMLVNPNVVSAMINPDSTAGYIFAGAAVKLVAKATKGQIVVDLVTGPTDGPIFGVILYNPRRAVYAAGDMVEIGCRGTYVWCEASTSISRGARVNITAPTASADALVTTVANNTDYQLGTAIDQTSTANDLIRVMIDPSDPNLAY